MSLFQRSVEKKYLNELDSALINKKYADFQNYFGNHEIQENIRNSKEEEFQEGFIRELFVNIFNYTLKPKPEYNIVLEKKNVDDTKKADGAILKNDHVTAVIELKSTSTADLDTVETQAFGYKNHHPECVYVITSNFEKLRFYIQNAVDYLEFDLFNLSKEQFSLLWLCLSKDNILNDLPLTIKESSVLQEEDVTKKLYADYSKFREAIFENIAKNNPDKDELLLFNKTQKLLDRFLFIFFAEDRLLLPPNSISEIVKQWTTLKEELDTYIPLYDRFKKYFGYMNTGYKGKKYDIFPYNGGLFLPDEILDNITIDDNILHKHTVKLSAYDFETDVDVNILGHIFEHSLAEIENVQAKLRGEQIDKQKTKRKKEGIYYTPKYITKYIVENTVGKLCEEKRNKLEIIDEEYVKGRKNRKKDTIKVLDKKLTKYKNWLLSLTILDPACGSGAFLNQALEFLIDEHKKVNELQAQLFGGGMVFSDITTEILEKNIYGVDLNEESVEIAKLSLWLRTAQKGRKLNTLSNNIKCGNSLIDDPEVAGDKAFNWQKEFPEIFAKGGFDVVIGNPPYVRSRKLFSESEKNYFLKQFETTSYQLDLYKLFIEKSCKLINKNGKLSFITPSVFLTNDYDRPLRKYILENYSLDIIATSNKDIFDDASVKTVVFLISNSKRDNSVSFFRIEMNEFHFEKKIRTDAFIELDYLINEKVDISALPIIQKLNTFKKLGEYFEVKNGIKVRKELLYDKKNDCNYKPFILGKNIFEYNNSYDNLYIDYKIENEKLYTNQAFRTKGIFEQEKLITRQILGKRIITCFDNCNYFTDQTTYVINKKEENHELKYLLCVLNSKLIYFYFINTFSDNKITFPKVKRSQLLKLPYNPNFEQNTITNFANKIIKLVLDFKTTTLKFNKYLQSQFNIERVSGKIQNWHELDFGEFIKELNKVIKKASGKKLTKMDEMDWMEVFQTKKAEAQTLKTEIGETYKEIDQIVYELYGLCEEEIKIVEESI